MKNEIWLPINGYENLYEISNLGNVKSLAKQKGFVFTKDKVFKLTPTSLGYLRVGLRDKNGNKKCFLVHRLVAIHFIGNPPINRPQVNHKNGIKTDNSVINLEWCNVSENILHAFKNKLKNPIRGEKSNLSKLTAKEVLEIRAIYPIIKSYKRLSIMYSMSFGAIRSIIKYKSWVDT